MVMVSRSSFGKTCKNMHRNLRLQTKMNQVSHVVGPATSDKLFIIYIKYNIIYIYIIYMFHDIFASKTQTNKMKIGFLSVKFALHIPLTN